MTLDTSTLETQDRIPLLIAARLNHDYVSPLTAISNALEILKMDSSQISLVLELIDESTKIALSELQFNRIAYGAYGQDEQLTIGDVRRRLTDFFNSSDIKIDTNDIVTPPLKSDAKLWFLAVLCLRSSFLTIEKLQIKPDIDGWSIQCIGTGMRNRSNEYRAENFWLQIADITPNMVHFPLFFAHLKEAGYEMIFRRNDELEISIKLWRKS